MKKSWLNLALCAHVISKNGFNASTNFFGDGPLGGNWKEVQLVRYKVIYYRTHWMTKAVGRCELFFVQIFQTALWTLEPWKFRWNITGILCRLEISFNLFFWSRFSFWGKMYMSCSHWSDGSMNCSECAIYIQYAVTVSFLHTSVMDLRSGLRPADGANRQQALRVTIWRPAR